jgi:hypothetical protein
MAGVVDDDVEAAGVLEDVRDPRGNRAIGLDV